MADYEHTKKLLASLGAQPHEINRSIRESQEHEKAGEEIFRYVKEIMGIDGYNAIWSLARALHASFTEIEDDPQKDMKAKIVLSTIAMALQAAKAAKAEKEKENGEG